MRGLGLVMIALSVLGAVPAHVYAQDTAATATAADTGAANTGAADTSSDSGAIWTQPSGRGFSTSFANGFWGGGLYGQEARVAFPLGTEHLRLQARAQLVHRFGDPYFMDFGARLGIAGGSIPLMNFVRAYGSGGFGFLLPVARPDSDPITGALVEKKIQFGLSGEFGLEVFLNSGLGIFVEVGGGGYFSGGYANGGHAMAGMNFYPF
jgi:hypothetical protein